MKAAFRAYLSGLHLIAGSRTETSQRLMKAILSVGPSLTSFFLCPFGVRSHCFRGIEICPRKRVDGKLWNREGGKNNIVREQQLSGRQKLEIEIDVHLQ